MEEITFDMGYDGLVNLARQKGWNDDARVYHMPGGGQIVVPQGNYNEPEGFVTWSHLSIILQKLQQGEDMSRFIKPTYTVDAIIWPEQLLQETTIWNHNLDIVRILCRIGTITKWQRPGPGKEEYLHFPYIYDVDGVSITFLPHWTFYSVETFNLNVPKSEEELRKAITAVKLLRELGWARHSLISKEPEPEDLPQYTL